MNHESINESKKTVTFAEVRASDEMVGPQGSESMRESRLESPTKSNFKVFMFGYGTGKFTSNKMEWSDMKRRQLRQQTTDTVSDGGDDENDRRRSGKKRLWRLIDVFRCGGGYDEEVVVKDLQTSFHTLKRFD